VVSEREPNRGDSYVLPLDDPDDIAHARALIAEGPSIGGAIAVAEIAPGADGLNRDWLAPGKPQWSWHVTRFDGFADATVEILDGNPSMVEEDVDFWIQNTNGFIGFWGYTVTAELAHPPYFPINPGFNDAWRNPEKLGGQGVFIVVLQELGFIFMSWFTYDLGPPDEDVQFTIGDPGHRWYTAFGPYEGGMAVLDLELTRGGIFDSDTVPEQSVDGTVTLKALSCREILLNYEIDSAGLFGDIPLERLAPDNEARCLSEDEASLLLMK
jgi:hypothetical protein